MKKETCNMCQKEMTMGIPIEERRTSLASLSFCINPECPNYALLQVGQEEMLRIKDLLEEMKKP